MKDMTKIINDRPDRNDLCLGSSQESSLERPYLVPNVGVCTGNNSSA